MPAEPAEYAGTDLLGRLSPALAVLPRIETDRREAATGQFPEERNDVFFRPGQVRQPQGIRVSSFWLAGRMLTTGMPSTCVRDSAPVPAPCSSPRMRAA